jgi:hypothetical protein
MHLATRKSQKLTHKIPLNIFPCNANLQLTQVQCWNSKAFRSILSGMDATDREAIDYLTMVPVDFFYEGKLILNVTSFVYPQFAVGQTFQVELQPTDRERTRRPAQDFTTAWFVIDKVHHKACEVRPGIFAFKVEVLLIKGPVIDASSVEIDSEAHETSIPRRLLKRDK